jgi:hypothetical protein
MPEPEADEPRRGKRNPPWSRDELILALDLYMRLRNTPIAKNAEEIAELSGFLGRMATSLGRTQSGSFRNPAGVYMKLINFRRLDPDYIDKGKVGLERAIRKKAQFGTSSRAIQGRWPLLPRRSESELPARISLLLPRLRIGFSCAIQKNGRLIGSWTAGLSTIAGACVLQTAINSPPVNLESSALASTGEASRSATGNQHSNLAFTLCARSRVKLSQARAPPTSFGQKGKNAKRDGRPSILDTCEPILIGH